MFNQPSSSQPRLVRGTVVLLENSITMRITEQHKRMERLEELIVDFERLDSELSAEESEIIKFEKRYFDLKLKFQGKINAIDASRSTNVSRQNISITIPTKQSSANFRLPKLNIVVFTGKFEDWINFKDLFVTAVHSQTSVDNIQKFQYLKDLFSDEPASLIKHIPLSNESYEEVWGKLVDR
ncbi:DUF1758 domain-containing protein [Trichonephila clavipes]|nr:DUF1758 domain-containing protein [Trichonephila clavipes]